MRKLLPSVEPHKYSILGVIADIRFACFIKRSDLVNKKVEWLSAETRKALR